MVPARIKVSDQSNDATAVLEAVEYDAPKTGVHRRTHNTGKSRWDKHYKQLQAAELTAANIDLNFYNTGLNVYLWRVEKVRLKSASTTVLARLASARAGK